MDKPATVGALEELGRVQLSKSFFMRDFLYSEISQIEGIRNVPDFPAKAIEAGRRLCDELLEPLQDRFGRIAIRSAYRSPAVNAKGAENNRQYSCADNERNFASHIWDYPDSQGYLGATACIVVPALLPWYERHGDWTPLAWWIHDNLPYTSQFWFPRLAAFNLRWSSNPNVRQSIGTRVVNPHTGNSEALVTNGVALLSREERNALVERWLSSLGRS
ncbi:peptidase M15 [Pseudomonas sp. JM0905a]|uniref:peptidase M15 n=1 Tax=Pseudomonas sp. JM0905a TaxID=2772484 RepID=UPI00168622C2|nr:peptidase M15 [Pseudomonas sp. JM0905a]MBD2835543.1 peptidase M15 [Pseudomonas sp. JM0905a]